MIAATLGVFAAWLIHTSVDWLHNLPGLTGVALFMAGLIAGNPRRRSDPRGGMGRTGKAATVALCAGVLILSLSLARQVAGEWYREKGQELLAENPRKALRESYRSLDFNAEAPQTYYLQAAAFARLSDSARAEASLRKALEKEPSSFVTWALLGDLAVRAGRRGRARALYTRASRLNPLDPALARRSRAKLTP